MATFRYFQMSLSGQYLHANEIEFYSDAAATTKINVNSSNVTLSSIYSLFYNNTKAVDGDYTYNTFFHTNNGSNEYIRIDLGEEKYVKKIRIYNEYSTGSNGNSLMIRRISGASIKGFNNSDYNNNLVFSGNFATINTSTPNGISGTDSSRYWDYIIPTITLNDLTLDTNQDGFTLSVSSDNTNLTSTFTYESNSLDVATIDSNGLIRILKTGTTMIKVSQLGFYTTNNSTTSAATTNYFPASKTCTLTITPPKLNPTITDFNDVTKTYLLDVSFNLNPTSTNNAGEFIYKSYNTDVATILGSTVTIQRAGTSMIELIQIETDEYYGVTASFILTVNPITPALTFVGIITTYRVEPFNITIEPTIQDSDSLINYRSQNTEIADVSGSILTIKRAGSTTIEASQDASGNYLDVKTTFDLSVNPITPALTFDSIEITYGLASVDIVPTTRDSHGSITYTSLNTNVATISGSTINILKSTSLTGGITINVSQDPYGNYLGTTTSFTLIVYRATPVLTFVGIITTYQVEPFNITIEPIIQDSDALINYRSRNTEIADVSGSILTIKGAGSIKIEAYQDASGNYLEAATTTFDLSVNPITPALTFDGGITTTYGIATFDIVPTIRDSDGSITYTSLNTNVATISGSTINILKSTSLTGGITINVSQDASGNYLGVTTSFTLIVDKASTPITGYYDLNEFTDGDTLIKKYGEIIDLSASSTGTDTFEYSYESSNKSIADISGNNVIIVRATKEEEHAVKITITRSVSDNYLGATTSFYLTVNKARPNIINNYINGINQSFNTPSFTLTDPSSNSTGLFIYTIESDTDDKIADISGNTVTIVGAGTAEITATQQATDNYEEGSIYFTLLVGKIYSSIITPLDLYKILGIDDSTFDLVDPSSNSTGSFSYSSLNEEVATILGNVVTLKGIGSTKIIITQAETTDYFETIINYDLKVETYPTIILNNYIITKTYGEPDFDLVSALELKSDSSGNFTYMIDDTSIADISLNSVRINKAGPTFIRITQEAKGFYLKKFVDVSLNVLRADPSFNFLNLYKILDVDDSTFDLVDPSSNSTGSFSYSSSNREVADISGNSVTLKEIGSTKIYITQQATVNYLAKTIERELTVKTYPTLNFNNINKTYGDFNFILDYTLKATSNSSGNFTYEIFDDTSVADISLNSDTGIYSVIIKKGGSTTIRATQAAYNYYLEKFVDASLNILRAPTTMSIFYDSNIEKKTIDIPFKLTAPNSNRAGEFIYSSDNTDVATVSGSTVTIRGAGLAKITAIQAVTDNYEQGTIDCDLTVVKAITTISNFYVSDIEKRNIDPSFNLIDPSSNRVGEFIYSSNNEEVATVSGSTVTIQGAGLAIITATQLDNEKYKSGSMDTFLYVKTYPTISFNDIEKTTIDPEFNLNPSSDSSGNFIYESSEESVATVLGSTVTIRGNGSTTITLTQEAKNEYSSGTKTCILTVKKYPIITVFNNIEKSTNDTSFNLITPKSNSSGLFTYTSSKSDVAIVVGSTVTIMGQQGETTITAIQDSNDEYSSGTISCILTVKKYPNIDIDTFPNLVKTYNDIDFSLNRPNSSNTIGAFKYSSSNNSVATVFDGNQVRIFKAGTTNIQATQEAFGEYSSGTIICTLEVNKLDPTITNFNDITKIFNDEPFSLEPKSLSPGLFTYSSTNADVADISGNIVTIVGYGYTTINAIQAATENYLQKPLSCLLTVNRANPVLKKIYIDTSGNLHKIIINTNSNGAFSYTSSDNNVATIFENNIIIVGAGTVRIEAKQDEFENYNEATIIYNLTINKANPTIRDFNDITKPYEVGMSFNLLGPNSNSNGAFTYTSSDEDVASVVGDVITIKTPGITKITAIQDATAIYKGSTISCDLIIN